MAQPRLIPCILLKNGLIVRSQGFRIHQIIGNPVSTISRLSNWNVDELILLDISADDIHDRRRDDHGIRYDGSSMLGLLRQIAEVSFMPLTVGGRIRTLDDIRDRLAAGADKVVINSQAVSDPDFISQAAQRFGSQCIVVSIDVLRGSDGRLEVYSERGTKPTGLDPVDWAVEAERRGAGEIFLKSIDRDGAGEGYDLALVRAVTDAVSVPVIACGGVGKYTHFPTAIAEGAADACAAANIFHFYELSYPHAKKACLDAGLAMRDVGLGSRWFPREPVYDKAREDIWIAERVERAHKNLGPKKIATEIPRLSWCKSCVYPSSTATYAEYDEVGECSGCRTDRVKRLIPQAEWDRRLDLLKGILEQARCRDGSRHDCVIGVSGGKDSYFQTHMIKNVLGYNPLLVTYFGNNYTPAGLRNLYRMKEVFNVDHVIIYPSVETLKKLNRLAFTIMGDMNWHAHLGIGTIPMRTAVRHKIPLVIWGEHGEMDLSGQFSMNDFVEWSYRARLEHEGRGFEWNYMVGREGLSAQDMALWQYPTDAEIFETGLRGVYLGNYVYWEANDHSKLMRERYGFEPIDEPFERTYRTTSNLDDMHENGIHDYLKFVKFGYGRCTDHATKDIRAGILSRGQAVDLVRKYDHIKSKDLYRWLDYVGMSEKEFDTIADTFRDPRVWAQIDGTWRKREIWEDGR